MTPPPTLKRVVGLPGAILMGLGSILGTGIFVSIGIAASIAGPDVLLAVALAAVVATFNGLSSASLAASHPVSGGTYAYGYRYLSPAFGFTAGWMFLCAKSASAATAALGFAGYALSHFGAGRAAQVALAFALVVAFTALTAGGLSRSNRTNALIVVGTLIALITFIAFGLPMVFVEHNLGPTPPVPLSPLFEATALMFVAYTGYGRIATLGEEVIEPRRTIPRAIILTLGISMILYIGVTAVSLEAVGYAGLAAATGNAAAPLAVVAESFGTPAVTWLVSLGALTAMASVLLNLILGLSRVLFAMARNRDMPPALAHTHDGSPRRAVLVMGALIAGLVLIGSVKTTWTFSAFSVLVYYAITNLAALRLPPEHRRYPRVVPALGLTTCLGLAFWVEPTIWAIGLGLIALGLIWQQVARRLYGKPVGG
jgi:APA family basic amino acid/polyamine antiporter